MPVPAQPISSGARLIDSKNPIGLTQVGIQHFNQWRQSINSIPVSVSGENVAGTQNDWTLANAPSGNVSVIGITNTGPVVLTPGKGNAWNYQINGKAITTEQPFESLSASYEYSQS